MAASGKPANGPTLRNSLMHSFLAYLVIGFVLFLILFPVLSSQIFIIWPWYGREWTVELLMLLVPFKYVTFLFA